MQGRRPSGRQRAPPQAVAVSLVLLSQSCSSSRSTAEAEEIANRIGRNRGPSTWRRNHGDSGKADDDSGNEEQAEPPLPCREVAGDVEGDDRQHSTDREVGAQRRPHDVRRATLVQQRHRRPADPGGGAHEPGHRAGADRQRRCGRYRGEPDRQGHGDQHGSPQTDRQDPAADGRRNSRTGGDTGNAPGDRQRRAAPIDVGVAPDGDGRRQREHRHEHRPRNEVGIDERQERRRQQSEAEPDGALHRRPDNRDRDADRGQPDGHRWRQSLLGRLTKAVAKATSPNTVTLSSGERRHNTINRSWAAPRSAASALAWSRATV